MDSITKPQRWWAQSAPGFCLCKRHFGCARTPGDVTYTPPPKYPRVAPWGSLKWRYCDQACAQMRAGAFKCKCKCKRRIKCKCKCKCSASESNANASANAQQLNQMQMQMHLNQMQMHLNQMRINLYQMQTVFYKCVFCVQQVLICSSI